MAIAHVQRATQCNHDGERVREREGKRPFIHEAIYTVRGTPLDEVERSTSVLALLTDTWCAATVGVARRTFHVGIFEVYRSLGRRRVSVGSRLGDSSRCSA